jgi:hypothetical protein
MARTSCPLCAALFGCAVDAREVLEEFQQFRLGVVRVLIRSIHNRPSVYRQTAEQDTRHDVRGLVVTALAA